MLRLLVFSLCILMSCSNNAETVNLAQVVSYTTQEANMENPIVLADIQGRIQSAFAQAIVSQNMDAMEAIQKELTSLYASNEQNLIQYWRAYLQFYIAIFHIQADDSNASENAVDEGIDWLKDMKQKNAEDYALLSMLQGFSIQFKGMRAMFLSKDIKKNAKTAIAIDENNLRAYYVYGSSDFYTPKKYGGGKEAEAYLLKAISLPVQQTPNEHLPSWGKEEAYELLIKHYIKTENWKAARKHFKDANTQFPNNYQISQLAARLVAGE